MASCSFDACSSFCTCIYLVSVASSSAIRWRRATNSWSGSTGGCSTLLIAPSLTTYVSSNQKAISNVDHTTSPNTTLGDCVRSWLSTSLGAQKILTWGDPCHGSEREYSHYGRMLSIPSLVQAKNWPGEFTTTPVYQRIDK